MTALTKLKYAERNILIATMQGALAFALSVWTYYTASLFVSLIFAVIFIASILIAYYSIREVEVNI